MGEEDDELLCDPEFTFIKKRERMPLEELRVRCVEPRAVSGTPQSVRRASKGKFLQTWSCKDRPLLHTAVELFSYIVCVQELEKTKQQGRMH